LLFADISIGIFLGWFFHTGARWLSGILGIGLIFVLSLVTMTLSSATMAYYWQTSALLDWDVVLDFAKISSSELSMDYGFVWENCGGLFLLFALGLVLVAGSLYWDEHKNPSNYYLLGTDHPLTRRRCSRRHALYAMLLLYFLSALIFRPSLGVWKRLARTPLLDLSKALLKTSRAAHSGLSAKTERGIAFCETISEALTTPEECFHTNPVEPNLEFLRGDSSGFNSTAISGIVFLIVESGRADAIPLNYNSSRMKQLLDEKWQAQRNVTLWFEKLSRESLHFRGARTVCSYTLKSLMGLFCGRYPMLHNTMVEYNMSWYGQEERSHCLPRLLADKGWATAFMQPGDSHFDHQPELMTKTGFLEQVDYNSLRANVAEDGKEQFRKMNYFGYADRALLSPVASWLSEKSKKGQPFLLSMLTNVLHHPFIPPPEWPKRPLCSKLKAVNYYLNSLQYTESFAAELFQTMKEALGAKIWSQTLVIVLGDHGMALNEHSRFGANENGYEEIFRIPLMFWMDNGNSWWQESYAQKQVDHEVANIDVFVTVLSLLARSRGATLNESEFGKYFLQEGQPLTQRNQDSQDRWFFSSSNPGFNMLIVKQGTRKLVYEPSTEEIQVFDLKDDPSELSPHRPMIDKTRMPLELQEWTERAEAQLKKYIAKNQALYNKNSSI